MGWQDLLQEEAAHLIIPWLGGRRIHRAARSWRVIGRLPREFGWYLWKCAGRGAQLLEEADCDEAFELDKNCYSGYLVGDRFIKMDARVDPDPNRLIEQTSPAYLVPPGLNRFTPVRVAEDTDGKLVYMQELFDIGPEEAVRQAFIDKKESIAGIAGVPPALDLSFQFATAQRIEVQQRREELERRRRREEQLAEARRKMGTGAGRRELAVHDFESAARAALSVGGAELLDVRQSHNRHEMVVQYRLSNRRLECVVHRWNMQVVDSGICLQDHQTGEKGDTYFTLESLPAVAKQAIDEGKLVVYRHVDGDMDDDGDDWDD